MKYDYRYLTGPLYPRRPRRRAGNSQPALPKQASLISSITAEDSLLTTFRDMRRVAGPAAGPDGVGLYDVSVSQFASQVRAVVPALIHGTYVPGPYRSILRPKPSGGNRELRIRNLIDRVISHAVNKLVAPRLDAVFLDCSHGYRPGRSVTGLIAELEATVIRDEATWLVHADIRRAFDSVRFCDLARSLERHFAHPGERRLIMAIAAGADQNRRTGIDQGDSLSPVLLNLILHHGLDEPLSQKGHSARYWRYADNLVFAETCEADARLRFSAAKEALQQLGMELHEISPVTNLRRMGASIDCFGYQIQYRSHGELELSCGRHAYQALELGLDDAALAPNPLTAVRQTVFGWLDARGPAMNDRNRIDVLGRVRKALRVRELREHIPLAELEQHASKAYERWGEFRTSARGRRSNN